MTDTEVSDTLASPRSDRWRWLAASFAVVAVAALAFAAFVLVRDDDGDGFRARMGDPAEMPMMSMDVDAMRDQCMAMHDDADWCGQMVDLMADHLGASTMPMRP